MSAPVTRITRGADDITAEVTAFDIRTFAVKDKSSKKHHWESTLDLYPPQPIEDVSIHASWEGVEYRIWPQA